MTPWVYWALIGWALLMAVLSTLFTVRTHRANRRWRRLWAATAPPCPPVDVLLTTGETITVQPTDVQQSWVYFARVPDPHLVREMNVGDMPPWTSVIPVPESWGPRP